MEALAHEHARRVRRAPAAVAEAFRHPVDGGLGVAAPLPVEAHALVADEDHHVAREARHGRAPLVEDRLAHPPDVLREHHRVSTF